MSKVTITGNTYPVKEELKSKFGARWNADAKGWDVPSEHANAARKLVASVAPVADKTTYHKRSSSGFKRRREGACPECGNKPDGGWGSPGYMCGEPCGN